MHALVGHVLLEKLIASVHLVLNFHVYLIQNNVTKLNSIMTSQYPRINVPTTASVMVREHVLLLVGAKESQDPDKK